MNHTIADYYLFLGGRGFLNFLPDKTYLKIAYWLTFRKKLDLKNPKTFNEKLQWLKLFNRQDQLSMIVDKYRVRNYIASRIGEDYLIPLIGVWDTVDEIDFDSLPIEFVLKCNHDSGSVLICKNKDEFDINGAKKFLNRHQKKGTYAYGREWPYKNVKSKIICEKLMRDSSNSEGLTDYKFFCFDGNADSVMVCLDRFTDDKKFYFFNSKWELLRLNIRGKNAPDGFTIPKPKCIDEMFHLAAELSKGFPFVRVDFYECDGKIYFGEMTFFPQSGFDVNLLSETDEYFGNMINLEGIRG